MKIIFKIIKGIVTFFLIIVLFLVLLQKVTDNKMAIGNIYIFEVASESMVPDYLIGDVIVVKKADGANLEVGDDVTYLGSESNLSGLTITHRIIRKRTENNVNYYVTKGIANSIEDPEISENDIYGKVIYKTVLFSFVGRLMTNLVVYYLLFISVGIAFAYEVITGFIIKDKDDDKQEEKEKTD